MNYLVLPISGGAFPHQLAIIIKLIQCGYVPDLSMGSSGGNIVAYIAASCEWKAHSVLRIARSLSSKLFINNWSGILPNFLYAYFKGSLYSRDEVKSSAFFCDLFTKESISKYEIWTGVCDVEQRKQQLFCNRDKNTAIFDKKIDAKTLGCLDPVFLEGDICKCAKVTTASAAIPTMVPPVKMNDKLYVDGGVSCASPLSIMAEGIEANFHIDYVSSFDLEAKNESVSVCYQNLLTVGKLVTTEMVNSLCFRDRAVATDLLKKAAVVNKCKINHTAGVCNEKVMSYIIKTRKDCNQSLVEYYPTSDKMLKLKDFDGEDVCDLISHTMSNFNYRLWWIGKDDLFKGLKDM